MPIYPNVSSCSLNLQVSESITIIIFTPVFDSISLEAQLPDDQQTSFGALSTSEYNVLMRKRFLMRKDGERERKKKQKKLLQLMSAEGWLQERMTGAGDGKD